MEKSLYNKGQAWYLDFTIGILIFTTAIIFYFKTTDNFLDSNTPEINDLISDASSISSSALSEGYPADWQNATVEKIGFSKNNRINNTLYNRSLELGYDRTRELFGTKFDYYLILKDVNNNIIANNGICGLGNQQTINISISLCSNFTMNKTQLAITERLVIYDSQITKMVVYVWD